MFVYIMQFAFCDFFYFQQGIIKRVRQTFLKNILNWIESY